ncbi:MAG: hypothetical protein L0H73_05880 [Nitrococcus sp.]|nr:hypothetical protein [Nitrococcus sp.]
MEKQLAHLQMIQAVINRMSVNSFLLKGWSVVLVSALFALSAGAPEAPFVYLAFFPAVAFWGLDGYFLWHERLFRRLYDRVRLSTEESIDFSMSTSVVRNEVDNWLAVTFSKTLNIFHGTVFGVIAFATLVTFVAT